MVHERLYVCRLKGRSTKKEESKGEKERRAALDKHPGWEIAKMETEVSQGKGSWNYEYPPILGRLTAAAAPPPPPSVDDDATTQPAPPEIVGAASFVSILEDDSISYGGRGDYLDGGRSNQCSRIRGWNRGE